MDCDPPGVSVLGIFQARILEWVVPFPPPRDLPNPGIKPMSPALAGGLFTSESLGKPKLSIKKLQNNYIFLILCSYKSLIQTLFLPRGN